MGSACGRRSHVRASAFGEGDRGASSTGCHLENFGTTADRTVTRSIVVPTEGVSPLRRSVKTPRPDNFNLQIATPAA